MQHFEESVVDIEKISENMKDLYSPEEFEKELDRIQSEFFDLIDRGTAALYLAVEKGIYSMKITPFDSLVHGNFVSVEGVITRIDQLRTFTRKDGTTGRVISLYLKDDTGNVRISFWQNRDIERILAEEFNPGNKLKVINGKVKIDNYGTTVNVGNYSIVKIIDDQ